jgi:hypothetical protein
MRVHKFILPIITFLTSVSSLSAQELRRYEIDVKDFYDLKVIENIKVDYKCNADSAGLATFTTTSDLASVLMFSNNKNRLDIQTSTSGVSYDNLPRITVYSRFLNSVENDGDSLVRVLTLNPTAAFKARQVGNGSIVVYGINSTSVDASLDTGNGTITLYGTANSAKFNLVGTGSIQAEDFKAENIKCSLLGTGFIGCDPTSTLTIVGASSGKVYYKGSPSIKNRSIGVKIIPITNDSVVK